jgi:hypothetical protein
MRKLLFSMVVLAMILGMFLPALPAAATVHSYAIQILTINGQPISDPPESFTIPVSIAGNCSATNFVGQISQYGVQVQWGDNSTVDVIPNVTQSGYNFSGTWGPVSHSYFPSGTYTIVVTLYHQMYPGAERSPDATFIFTLTVTFAGSNSPICQGGTLQLTGKPDGMSSYAWIGPNGFTSSLQNPSRPNATPSMSGTYTLTITNAIGTTDSSSTNVIVNPLPDSAITAPSAVCAESTGHTASVPDAGPGASYSWSVTGQGIITGVSDTRTIAWNAINAGTATISVVVTSVWGCTSNSTINVTVNPKLVATASSNSPVYEEGTILLSGGPSGMVSYSWTGPNGFTSSLQNPTIPDATLAMAGTYGLTVINTSGCTGSNSTDVVIYAKPVATASNSSPACEGSTISLSGGPDGMVSYSWTGPNDFSSSLQSPTIPNATLAMAGTYTLTVTFSVGSTGTAITDVTVNAKPVTTASSNSPVCEGSTISLSGGPDGMANYSWTGPNGFSSSLQSPTITDATTAMAGTYTLNVTSTSGCTGTAASTTVEVSTLPVATADSNSPVCEGSTISLSGGPDGMASYSWTGPNGFTSNLQSPTISDATLDMAGTYTLTVTNTGGCTDTTSTDVAINAKPAATADSNSPVCEGSTISLSGGPDGMASYSWTGPNGFTSNLQSPTITNATLAMAGTYTLNVTSTSGCTGTAASTDVVVNAKPVATAGSNSPVYETTTISLTGSPDGMASYSWTGPNGFSSSVQKPTIPNVTLAMGGTYTLTVTNTNGCTNSATASVTVLPVPVPTAPTLLSPANGAYAAGTSITYRWNASAWATSYKLTVSTSSNPLDTSKYKTNTVLGNVTQYTDTGYPNTGTKYYWWVNACNSSGCAPQAEVNANGFWFINWPPPPVAPTLVGPGNAAAGSQGPGNATYVPGTSITYSWNASPGATMYWITVSKSSDRSDASQYKINGLLGNVTHYTDTAYPNNGTTYYWWINAGNQAGWAPISQVIDNELTFINGARPPSAPILLSPGNGTVVSGTSITFEWNASALATNYYITVSTSPDLSDSSMYKLSGLLGNVTQYTDTGYPNNGSTYYWWINAGNSGGWAPQADVRANGFSFVNYTAPPSAPTLVAPGNNTYTSGTSITFRWNASAGATNYYITVSTSSDPSNSSKWKVSGPVGNVLQYTNAGYSNNGITYYWWVSAGNSGGWSPQEQVGANGFRFINGTQPPPAPILVSPGNGTVVSGTSVTFRWNASARATMYYITVSTSSDPSDSSKWKVSGLLGNVLQYTNTGYPNTGTTYYWWVNAGNSGGWAPQADVRANGFWFVNHP